MEEKVKIEKSSKFISFPLYLALVALLPAIVFCVVAFYFLPKSSIGIQASIQTINRTNKELGSVAEQLNNLQKQLKNSEESMKVDRWSLSLPDMVKRSWDHRELVKQLEPKIAELKSEKYKCDQAITAQTKDYQTFATIRQGEMIAVSFLGSWILITMLTFYSLRDRSKWFLLLLGLGTSVLGIAIKVLFPVLFVP